MFCCCPKMLPKDTYCSFLFYFILLCFIKIFFIDFLKEKCYIYNIFTANLQHSLSGKLLLAITSRQKSNFNGGFKLEPITI